MVSRPLTRPQSSSCSTRQQAGWKSRGWWEGRRGEDFLLRFLPTHHTLRSLSCYPSLLAHFSALYLLYEDDWGRVRSGPPLVLLWYSWHRDCSCAGVVCILGLGIVQPYRMVGSAEIFWFLPNFPHTSSWFPANQLEYTVYLWQMSVEWENYPLDSDKISAVLDWKQLATERNVGVFLHANDSNLFLMISPTRASIPS